MARPEPADMEITDDDRSRMSRVAQASWVWLAPLAALIAALAVAWNTYLQRGPMIEIVFDRAEGIEEAITTLKYREVTVGRVETLRFTDDLQSVRVGVRVDREVAPFIDAGARFWVVQPRVTTRGITGLETVLSGVYLQGDWDSDPGGMISEFRGLETPPLVVGDGEGLEIVLRAPNGGRISMGAPIVYKGVTVGNIDTPILSDNGLVVTAKAFIEAPHDALITSATKFWDSSGISFSVGAEGFSVDIANLASLIEGGVTFDTVLSGGRPVEPGHVFDVFDSQEEARTALFAGPAERTLSLSLLFENSISGLEVGAPVEFQGLRVGEVTGLGAQVVEREGLSRVNLRVALEVEPRRLGLDPDITREEALDFFAVAVGNGLRARLAATGLLSTALKIELTVDPDAPRAGMETGEDGQPILPTTEDAATADMVASARGVLDRVAALPVEELMIQARDVMANLNRILSSEALLSAPDEALGLISDARDVFASEAARAVMREAADAMADLSGLTSALSDGAAVTSLISALERSDRILASVENASDALPQLLEEYRGLAADARALPVPDLVSAATDLVAATEALIASDETAQVPEALAGALTEIEATLAALREGGAVDSVNATLASAQSASAAIEVAAADLPGIAERVDSVSREAEALLRAYGGRSDFNAQTLAAIRDLRDSARAVSSLARSIERNPTSLLTGR